MTHKTTIRIDNIELSFTDADIVDIDSVDCFADEYNPCNSRLWLLHDHGFTICVVQADSLQDALDAAVDADKLDQFLIDPKDMGDYPDESGISYLGNASEPFDIENVSLVQLPLPKRSIARLYGELLEFGHVTHHHPQSIKLD